MKELEQLEQSVTEANMLLSQRNWRKIVPTDCLNEAHTRMVEVRTRLLDSVFHAADVLDALQYFIDQQPNVGELPQKSRNDDGVEYSTEDLLKMRLRALYVVTDPAIVDDLVKYVNMYGDELRAEIAILLFANHQLKKAIKNSGMLQG